MLNFNFPAKKIAGHCKFILDHTHWKFTIILSPPSFVENIEPKPIGTMQILNNVKA